MDLHTAVFLLFSALSVLHSVCIVKIEFLSAIFEDGNYSTVSLSGFWTLGKITAILILGWDHEGIMRMLGCMEKYEKFYPIMRARSGPRHKLEYFIFFAIISTIGTVVLEIWSIYNLGLGEALLMGSHTLAKCLFLWTDGNLSEKALLLKLEYGSELTLGTVVMGGILIASEIISILHTSLVLGFMMLFTVAMHAYFADFISDIREFHGNRRKEKFEVWKRRPVKSAHFWRRFKMLRDVFEAANDAFNELFRSLLSIGLICICSFLSVSFLGSPTINWSIFLVHLVLLEVWLLYLGKIAEENGELCEWIRNYGANIGSVRVGRVSVSPLEVLEELEKEPIGLGHGRFVIRHTPHYLILKILNQIWFAIFGRGNDK